ncbi:sulfoquinovosidase-like [Penaeus japonicus]|uniref:sulfoquinovosidase-like n=1 Tax=Penaeus japonicus TaxID=27405 RepID=UPI001C713CB2|nr:sulfoquinovosidase-like [Penaeus japonicus]
MADARVMRAFLVLLLTTLTKAELTQLVIGEEIIVSFDGHEIFHHTPENPVITFGVGTANYTEDHGMFDVQEDIVAVVPIDRLVRASNRTGSVRITLGSTVDPEVEIRLTADWYVFGYIGMFNNLMTHSPYNRMWLRLSADADEKVFGGGEQFTYFNLRGHHFPIWTSEQGVGRDAGIIANITDIEGDAGGEYYTTYWPEPSFVSSKHYSLVFDDYNYMVMNFSAPNYHEFYIHDNSFMLRMYFNETMMNLIPKRSNYLTPLPDWIITGAILSLQRGTQEVLDYYELAKGAGVNVSALWIQDWSGTTETIFGHRVYWNWQWNETYYPGLDEVITGLAQEGVGVMAYINPYLIEGSTLYEEADALGFLMADAQGESYKQDFGGFLAGTVDLVNSEARDWYSNKIVENMINLGLRGWMADFGEYTRTDMFTRGYTTETPAQIHNHFPSLWASCNSYALNIAGKHGEVVPFMRSGGRGSNRDTYLAWAGDQNVDWSLADGVASTIVAALNLGLSGMCVTHFDIGGYTTQPPVLQRSKELFLRSAEYAVFTPVMRTHEGNKPKANHQFYSDEDTLQQFARLTQMHARLAPYTRAVVDACFDAGTPAQAPMFLYFEEDPGSWDIQYQYMFGPDLIVAPIIHKGEESQTVYIPGGEDSWQHLWEGVIVSGPGEVEVSVPLGYPAVFYRQGSAWAPLFQEIARDFGAGFVPRA